MAKKRPGPYVGISANYADDEKIMEAGEDAELLYIRMLAYAARTPLTEGWVSRAVIQSRLGILPRTAYDNSGNATGNVPGTDALSRAQTLLEVGLIEADGDGFRVSSWLKWNRSVEEMGKERQTDRKRKGALTRGSAETVPEKGSEKGPETPPVPTNNDQDQDQDHSAGSAETKKKKSETTFPDDFSISSTHRDKASNHGIDVDWQRIKFEDHHRAKGSKFIDWSRAFHTWLNNAIEFQGPKQSTPAPKKHPDAPDNRTVFEMTPEEFDERERKHRERLQARRDAMATDRS